MNQSFAQIKNKLSGKTARGNKRLHPLLSKISETIYPDSIKSIIGDSDVLKNEFLSEYDISHLPRQIQRYLVYAGAIGRPKTQNAKIEYVGVRRKNDSARWVKFKSTNYFFSRDQGHTFRLNSGKSIHRNKKRFSTKLLTGNTENKKKSQSNTFNQRQLLQGEMVKLFNEMCLTVPGSLINSYIEWKIIDKSIVKARFTNNNLPICATLFFDEKDRLINFFSYDNHDVANTGEITNYPWSTPVYNYKSINGILIPDEVRTIIHKPGSDFVSSVYQIKNIEYNIQFDHIPKIRTESPNQINFNRNRNKIQLEGNVSLFNPAKAGRPEEMSSLHGLVQT